MKNHQKNIIIASALIVTSIIMIIFVLLPARAKLVELHEDTMAEGEKMNNLLSAGQSINQNQENLELVEGELQLIDGIFVKKGSELFFIKTLERIASQNNIEQNINFTNEDIEISANKITPIEININANGSLNELLKYINEIEMLDNYISITKINLKNNTRATKNSAPEIKDGEEINQTKINASIKAVTYWKE